MSMIWKEPKFYSKLLNVELSDVPEMEEMPDMKMVFFPWVENAPNANGVLVKMNDMPVGAGGTMVYFQCEDCSLEESRIETAGGKVIQPKMSIREYEFCSMCSMIPKEIRSVCIR